MTDKDKMLEALAHLRKEIQDRHPLLEANIHRTSFHNPWFDKEKYWQGLDALVQHLLDPLDMEKWCANYQFPISREHQKIIGLIFAGNIPLVGFHDFLTVYLSGHAAEIKLSSKDPYVFPAILDILGEKDSGIKERIRIVEKFEYHEAVIATGSNNTNRYFEKYFENYPSILRKNRTSVAVLDGTESNTDLEGLAHDVFDYFGLGCRNVTKLYVPEDYDFEPLLKAMSAFSSVMNNFKYKNNYDYNLSIELLNRTEIISTDHVLLKKEPRALSSPVGMVFYEEYTDPARLAADLGHLQDRLQTVVGKYRIDGVSQTDFGKTQEPGLFDYPDGEDIGHFLFDLSCKTVS